MLQDVEKKEMCVPDFQILDIRLVSQYESSYNGKRDKRDIILEKKRLMRGGKCGVV